MLTVRFVIVKYQTLGCADTVRFVIVKYQILGCADIVRFVIVKYQTRGCADTVRFVIVKYQPLPHAKFLFIYIDLCFKTVCACMACDISIFLELTLQNTAK